MRQQSVGVLFILIAMLSGGALSANAQTTIYVDASANGSNNGSSWCDAYVFLQDALAAATQGGISEIRVAQGTYKPDQGANQTQGDRNASFQLVNHVAIRGGYAGCGAANPNFRDIKFNSTILSGDLNGDDDGFHGNDENSFHVVIASGEGPIRLDPDSIIEGFLIVGGNPNSFRGGGIRVLDFDKPTIKSCIVQGNSGSGIEVIEDGQPIISDCDIRWNRNYGIDIGEEAFPTIVNCWIRGNVGTGIDGFQCKLQIGNSIIAFNSGTGIQINDDRGIAPNVEGSIIFGNSGRGIAGFNSAYYDNQTVDSSIIWANAAVTNSQVYLGANTFCGSIDSLTLMHSDIEGGAAQIHWDPCYFLDYDDDNIDADPMFANPAGVDGIPATDDDNFRLCPGSPAIGMVPSWLTTVECCRDSDCGTANPCTGTKFCGPDHSCVAAITDCNKNGVEDECDVATGSSADRNGNRIPDECEPHGDCDGNGSSGFADYQQFPNCLTGPSAYLTRAECHCFDFGSDGMISIFDFAALQTMFSGQ